MLASDRERPVSYSGTVMTDNDVMISVLLHYDHQSSQACTSGLILDQQVTLIGRLQLNM